MNDPTLTIGDVARRAGVNPSAIRYYERVGVLPKPDRLSGQRRYTAETVRQLHVINLAKRAGFTLDQVTELLRSDRPRDVLNTMAQRNLPAVRALGEYAAAMQAGLVPPATDDMCTWFADSIERLAEPPR